MLISRAPYFTANSSPPQLPTHCFGLRPVGRMSRGNSARGSRFRYPKEKKAAFETFGAVACDMETFAVAEVCARMKTHLISVRVITDGAGDELPPEVARLLGQPTFAGKLGAAAAAILKRPSSATDMWKLRQDATKRGSQLAKFLLGLLPQLP